MPEEKQEWAGLRPAPKGDSIDRMKEEAKRKIIINSERIQENFCKCFKCEEEFRKFIMFRIHYNPKRGDKLSKNWRWFCRSCRDEVVAEMEKK